MWKNDIFDLLKIILKMILNQLHMYSFNKIDVEFDL